VEKQARKPIRQKDGLVKRGTKWAYVLRIPDPVTGKTKQKWIGGFDNEKDAKLARDKARVNVSTGIYVTPSKITVEEFLGKWIELHAMSLKPSTEASYRVNLDSYLIPCLGSIPLANLRPSHVQKFYADLRREGRKGREGRKDGKPLSAKSVQNAAAVLKKALQYAVDVDGLLVKNPASRVPLPKGESQRNETWMATELQFFLEGITDHRLFAFFRLSTYSGARRGEL
jgi:integrase